MAYWEQYLTGLILYQTKNSFVGNEFSLPQQSAKLHDAFLYQICYHLIFLFFEGSMLFNSVEVKKWKICVQFKLIPQCIHSAIVGIVCLSWRVEGNCFIILMPILESFNDTSVLFVYKNGKKNTVRIILGRKFILSLWNTFLKAKHLFN